MGLGLPQWLTPARSAAERSAQARSAQARSASIAPPWWVAVGSAQGWQHQQEAVTWQDDRMAIAAPHYALSPNQRFVVTGAVDNIRFSEAWACDRGISAMLEEIAAVWQRSGWEGLARLTGQFALAIWDRDQQDLWAIRDPVGAYPLYYTPQGATRWIAPRLATLRRYHAADLNPVALRDYLCCAFVPGEQTLWAEVCKVRPGTGVQMLSQKVQTYWRVQEQIAAADRSLPWHGQRLRSQLETVVQDLLPIDRPVGVSLSGGLDSSCITALVARCHSRPVHTYSIHFGEALPHELAFSSQVAQQYSTQHHILEIPPQTLWQRLPETMAQFDEPIGDPLTVPNKIIAEAAQADVGVILNGEGGDPCFGGPKNQPMLLDTLYSTTQSQEDATALHQYRVQAYLRSFQKCADDLSQLLRPEVLAQISGQESCFGPDLQNPSFSYLNRLMLLNIHFKGADHILTKVNNLTQSVGLVGRSPLFDPRIVALSMAIPPAYKLAGAREKAVLKAAVADILPDSILNRPKSGMLVPVQYGFRHLWRRSAAALLLSPRARIGDYLDRRCIRQWLTYQGDPTHRYGVKLWLLATLEYWLQAHV